MDSQTNESQYERMSLLRAVHPILQVGHSRGGHVKALYLAFPIKRDSKSHHCMGHKLDNV